MSVEYQVVMADDRIRFCDKVESHIRVGFICQGGVWFGPARHGGWLFMQAMTRVTPEEGDAIKPEPKEIWRNRFPSGFECGAFLSKDEARQGSLGDVEHVLYREVIE